METDSLLKSENDLLSVEMRPSGRVGLSYRREKNSLSKIESGEDDIAKIYQVLLDLHGRQEGNLTEAISYGLKLLDREQKPTKRKSVFIRSIFKH